LGTLPFFEQQTFYRVIISEPKPALKRFFSFGSGMANPFPLFIDHQKNTVTFPLFLRLDDFSLLS